MLILRRRCGETLLIGDDIEIEFLEVAAGAVKIGVRAPRDVLVLRKELKVTREQNLAAARGLDVTTLDFSQLHPVDFPAGDSNAFRRSR